MGVSEETSKQNNEILKAIADLSRQVRKEVGQVNRRIDQLETKFDEKIGNLEAQFESYRKFADTQFEAIREGIVFNSVRFDRLESEFFKVRPDISSIRADIKEMGERRRKELV